MAYHPPVRSKKKNTPKDGDEGEEDDGEGEPRLASNMLLMPMELTEDRRLWLATVEDNASYHTAYHVNSVVR